MTYNYLLAHDLGTTGDKATLWRADGTLAASVFSPYATSMPAPGQSEQSPHDWWNAVRASTRALMEQTPGASTRIAAIGLCGMMNGCLLVDDRGAPIGPAMIHADVRAAKQAEEIARRVDPGAAYRRTGNRIAPYFTLAKLAWLAAEEPDRLRRARWCLQTKDYIAGRLTGTWGITDRSDASLTGCFDLLAGDWDAELITVAGFASGLLPELRGSTEIIGRLTPDAANSLGLPTGIPVALGGGDGACATAGAGAASHGDTYHYMGGTSWVAAITDSLQLDPHGRVSVFCALDPAQYVVYGTVQSAGSAIDWFLRAIGVGKPHNDETEWEALERIVAESPAGSNGLFFLPYLAGERSPIWDASARGLFFGLTSAHDRSDLARAVFEGVAYALRGNLAVLNELGLGRDVVRVLGGGMRSGVWRGILSAVYSLPLQRLENLSEATSAGAAMAAAVGVGMFIDLRTAAPAFAPLGAAELPDPDRARLYARHYPFFASLYGTMADRFAALSELLTGG